MSAPDGVYKCPHERLYRLLRDDENPVVNGIAAMNPADEIITIQEHVESETSDETESSNATGSRYISTSASWEAIISLSNRKKTQIPPMAPLKFSVPSQAKAVVQYLTTKNHSDCTLVLAEAEPVQISIPPIETEDSLKAIVTKPMEISAPMEIMSQIDLKPSQNSMSMQIIIPVETTIASLSVTTPAQNMTPATFAEQPIKRSTPPVQIMVKPIQIVVPPTSTTKPLVLVEIPTISIETAPIHIPVTPVQTLVAPIQTDTAVHILAPIQIPMPPSLLTLTDLRIKTHLNISIPSIDISAPVQIATINVRSLEKMSSVTFLDLTDERIRESCLTTSDVRSFAKEFEEVLIVGKIPKECIEYVNILPPARSKIDKNMMTINQS